MAIEGYFCEGWMRSCGGGLEAGPEVLFRISAIGELASAKPNNYFLVFVCASAFRTLEAAKAEA